MKLPNEGGRYVLEKGTARRVEEETPAPQSKPKPTRRKASEPQQEG